jgi:hypothetical protein
MIADFFHARLPGVLIMKIAPYLSLATASGVCQTTGFYWTFLL